MNWLDLTAFQAVAEERSFTRAAVGLRVTQPVLSVRVRRLERALGARLLCRSTRAVDLTPAGQVLAEWVDRTRQDWHRVQHEVIALAATPPAARTLSVRVGLARMDAGRLLDHLDHRHPEMEWRLGTAASPQGLIEQVRSRTVQVGVWCRWPYSEGVDLEGLRSVTAARAPVDVLIAAGHPMAGTGPIDLVRLADEEWVAGADRDLRGVLDRICALHGGFVPRVTHLTDDRAQAQAVLATGRAVMLGNRLTPCGPGVVRLPLRGAPRCETHVTWLPDEVTGGVAAATLAAVHLDAEEMATADAPGVERVSGER